MPARFPLALALSVVVVALPACKRRRSQVETAPPAPAASDAEPEKPVDQLLPGEIAEGDEAAFGLPIPRRMVVSARFDDAVFASGRLDLERVANYVRERVIAERVETGPSKTVFTRATPKKSPSRIVRIEVTSRGEETELVVRDETRPPAEEGLTPEERWRKLGLKPDGTPLDPTRLE